MEGRVIQITDLDEAIEQVEQYMSYTHVDAEESLVRLEQQRHLYWKDIYQKLLALRSIQPND